MMADVVGKRTQPEEIVFMNGLTVNLHLLLVIVAYMPKVLLFPWLSWDTNHTHADRKRAVLGRRGHWSLTHKVFTPKGEHLLREEDILELIENEGDTIAVLLLPGIQYYTGQRFNVKRLTDAARSKGCLVLWDMAHAVCNVELKLNEWGVDLAVWCTYKYMNSGPGSMGVAFVSSAFRKTNPQLPALRGWWGNHPKTKFVMRPQFDPCPSADVFKLSNSSPLLVGPIMATLEMFKEIKESDRLRKQFLLTGYLEFLLTEELGASHDISDSTRPFHILSPDDPSQRGSQLSIHLAAQPHITHQELQRRGVLCDLRMPS
ncbi:kynureninase, putative, partial [Ixodes scapularis]